MTDHTHRPSHILDHYTLADDRATDAHLRSARAAGAPTARRSVAGPIAATAAELPVGTGRAARVARTSAARAVSRVAASVSFDLLEPGFLSAT